MAKRESAIEFNRVSDEEQRKGSSLEAQELNNKQYAKSKNLKIVKSWSVDESASKEDDRKLFFQAVNFLRENNIKHILFDKVDRACRGFKTAVLIEQLFESEGVTFHFTRQNLTIHKESPSHDKTQLYFHIMFAKIYVENLKSEIKKGSDHRLNDGHWNYTAPFGYRNKRDENGKAYVEIFESEAAIVRRCFEAYASSVMTQEDIETIIKKGTNRKNAKRLVDHMLQNPFYYGAVRVKGKIIENGKHTPIISKELFDQVQKVREFRARNAQRRPGSRVIKPLLGLLKCHKCGHAITGESKVKPKTGRTYVYYFCANRKCSERKNRVNQESLFKQLVRAFEPFKRFSPKATAKFIENIKESWEAATKYAWHSMKEIELERAEIKRKVLKIEGHIEKGIYSRDKGSDLINALLDQLDQKDQDISSHICSDSEVFKRGLQVIELFTSVGNYMENHENWLDKTKLVKTVLSDLVLKNGTIEYYYAFPFDQLFEIAKRHNWWKRTRSY